MGGPHDGSGWERLFWLVFERTSNPVSLLDDRRLIVACNDAATHLFAGTREQLIGTSMADYVQPAERDESAREWERFLKTGEYAGTRDLVRRDHTEVRVDFAARLADIGGRRLAIYVAMVSDGHGEVHPAVQLPLTAREREVVTLISLGKETGEIAAELHVSPETVRTHVRNAMAKLDVHTRAQLVAVVLCAEQTLHPASLALPDGR